MTGLEIAILGKLRSTLPIGWFDGASPNLETLLLGGPTQGLASAHLLLQDVTPQLRIRTATDGVLDLIAGDFFGVGLPRLSSESDDSYKVRILASLFRDQATRRAMRNAIGYYTGVYPDILEYGEAVDPSGFIVTKGDDTTYGYGAVVKPHHAFITVYRIAAPDHPGVGGYGNSAGGYGMGSMEYTSPVTANYEYLFQMINSIKPIGTKIWVRVINGDADTLVGTYGATLADPIVTGSSGEILTDDTDATLTYNP